MGNTSFFKTLRSSAVNSIVYQTLRGFLIKTLTIGEALFPWALLMAYFFHAVYKAFPSTAYMTWYTGVVKIEFADFNDFTAALFSVWNWKPLFGLWSDLFPLFGYHRKPYILICEVFAGLSMIVTGAYVKTLSWAYVVRIFDNVCECFAQLMLDITLVDFVSFDTTAVSAGRAQSLKMIASWVGCLFGYSVAIPVYSDKHYLLANPNEKSKHIIQWNSVFAFSAAIFVTFGIHETRNAQSGNLVDLFNIIKNGFLQRIRILFPVIPTLLFFFLCKCLPDDTDNWSMYAYSVVGPSCYNGMNIASAFGGILSGVVYMAFCTRLSFIKTLVFSTLATIVLVVPKLFMMPQKIHSLPMSVCTYSKLESFFSSFATQFAILPLLVIATFYCPKQKRLHGMVYACYIGCFDLGSTVSGPITAAITRSLDIKFGQFQNLWKFEIICAACQLLVILFCLLLPKKAHGWEKTEEELMEEQDKHDDDLDDALKKDDHYVAVAVPSPAPVASTPSPVAAAVAMASPSKDTYLGTTVGCSKT